MANFNTSSKVYVKSNNSVSKINNKYDEVKMDVNE